MSQRLLWMTLKKFPLPHFYFLIEGMTKMSDSFFLSSSFFFFFRAESPIVQVPQHNNNIAGSCALSVHDPGPGAAFLLLCRARVSSFCFTFVLPTNDSSCPSNKRVTVPMPLVLPSRKISRWPSFMNSGL